MVKRGLPGKIFLKKSVVECGNSIWQSRPSSTEMELFVDYKPVCDVVRAHLVLEPC